MIKLWFILKQKKCDWTLVLILKQCLGPIEGLCRSYLSIMNEVLSNAYPFQDHFFDTK